MGLLLVDTHLGGSELLPPSRLRSDFSVILCKPRVLPLLFRPKRGWHASGKKPWRPARRPRRSLGLRPSPPRVPLRRPATRRLQWADSFRPGPDGASALARAPRSGVGVRLSLWLARFLRVQIRSDHIATPPPGLGGLLVLEGLSRLLPEEPSYAGGNQRSGLACGAAREEWKRWEKNNRPTAPTPTLVWKRRLTPAFLSPRSHAVASGKTQ